MNHFLFRLIAACGCTGFFFSQAHALSQNELKQMIECSASHQQYAALGADYEKEFKTLGWKRINLPDQPLLYVYKNAKPINLFGHATHEIALSGNAILALYRDADVQQLAQQFKIPEYTEYGKLPFFRGVKKVRTERGVDGDVSYHINLNLSEMQGKSNFVLLGCSYEPDREEMERLLNSTN
ncbi:hypothetical protein [Acinetobacter sp. MD2(2019)]|uniref:hypothetical protein n=1 Tax=Acinetobacter sp. MD2(2019) TaxID=2605273 RepID=UPI002D1F3FE0|nr:hypothetical protein [Acinetobacter sp. MD2(2019)]MEB3753267.1 hypothetical protein [Acinetobacter sp. MD2(2019)]